MSRPNRFERRLTERRQARQSDRERELEELARDLRLAVRSLAIVAGARGPMTRELLSRADELLGSADGHVTGDRGE